MRSFWLLARALESGLFVLHIILNSLRLHLNQKCAESASRQFYQKVEGYCHEESRTRLAFYRAFVALPR